MSSVQQVKCDGCGKREDIPSDAYSMHSSVRPDGWLQISIAVYPTSFLGSQRLSDFCSYHCMDEHVLRVIREKVA